VFLFLKLTISACIYRFDSATKCLSVCPMLKIDRLEHPFFVEA